MRAEIAKCAQRAVFVLNLSDMIFLRTAPPSRALQQVCTVHLGYTSDVRSDLQKISESPQRFAENI